MNLNDNVSSFDLAQQSVNFVILCPSNLPYSCFVNNISLKKESRSTRSSIRFEILSKNRVVRVKQFYYDWGIPIVYADTNLISPGKSFEIDGIVGFIGIDYKGNQAACYARWFTNVELSVLKGRFGEDELISIIKSLTPLDSLIIEKWGKKSYTTTSYTARYGIPKWQEDEISRVIWYENNFDINKRISSKSIFIPSFEYQEFFLDSIGFNQNKFGVETHFLYRSKINYTDGIWFWLTPEEMIENLSYKVGENIGVRQSWNVKKEKFLIGNTEITMLIHKQNAKYYGWYAHWKIGKYIYQLFIRPSVNFNKEKLTGFIKTLNEVK
ncbi:hypothetical protein ACQKND_12425 [Viridibacillus arvi]|uniref:hypothetical protein n=1 Tax=Viridibacillus arvi TaxID=263475 RepID=UPI003CFEF90A